MCDWMDEQIKQTKPNIPYVNPKNVSILIKLKTQLTIYY